MIRAEGLGWRSGGVQVVGGVDLEVGEGEAVALLGRNGSGRSTLLRLLATLVRPSSGGLRIDGIDAVREPLRARRRIGYAGPQPALHDRLTAAEHLGFVAAARGLEGAGRSRAAAAALRLSELEPQRSIGTLSAGLRQRLALAAALISRPPVVLVDGGLGQLDPVARRRYAEALRERRRQGAAIVISCNSLEGLERLCGRVAVLDAGRMVARSSLAEFEGALPALERLAGEPAGAGDEPQGLG